jgi:hypothetical protein
MAADAKQPPGLKPFQTGAHGKFHVTGWTRLEQTLEWEVIVPKEDIYAVNVLPRRDGNQPRTVEMTSKGQTLSGAITPSLRGWTTFGLLTSTDGRSWTMLPE